MRLLINELLKYPDFASITGSVSDTMIESCEGEINIKFPPSYRLMLRTVGSILYDGGTIYGIVNKENYLNMGAIRLVKEFRRETSMPEVLLPVYPLGEGTYYCIDTSIVNADGESPVVAWMPGAEAEQSKETIANSFKDFFREEVGGAFSKWKKENNVL